MENPVVIVGGGMAGLTAAAYLCKAGLPVMLFEKEDKTGGLVNSFEYSGFIFDGGIRAIENSGIVMPMLRQLGLDIPFVKNAVSIGIGKDVVTLRSKDSLQDYLALLRGHFPDQAAEIGRFGGEIRQIMQYMDVLYGIDNPLFLDLKSDRRYLVKTILPWLVKYLVTIGKIDRLNRPVAEYLRGIIGNDALIDMIAQHFFKDTPTFFALSYFSLYLDYGYPSGGTGVLADTLRTFIASHGGEIRCGTLIVRLDPEHRTAIDSEGHKHPYQKLIWCADSKQLYKSTDISLIKNRRVAEAIASRRIYLADKTGGDSVLTLYLMLDLAPSYFSAISDAHFFYTPVTDGLGGIGPPPLPAAAPNDTGTPGPSEDAVKAWLSLYFKKTTFEISCPAMRDERLAPPGKTGLIISALFDFSLARQIADAGWYEAFKDYCAQAIIDVLDASIYPGIKPKVTGTLVATPLTLERLTGSTDGAITGWAFTNTSMPAVHSMRKVAKSVLTPIPHVYQAGQWVFSPSGLPISILTGKLAADQVIKPRSGSDRETRSRPSD